MNNYDVIYFSPEMEKDEFIDRYNEDISAIFIVSTKDEKSLESGAYSIPVSEIDDMYRSSACVISDRINYLDVKSLLFKMGFYNIRSVGEFEAEKLYAMRKDNNIFFILTPCHGNIGDQAIALASLMVVRRLMPEYNVIEIDINVYHRIRLFMKDIIGIDDKIYLTGGGFLGSLWLDGGENLVREILYKFPENEIVIFPQTIFFEHNDYGRAQKYLSLKSYSVNPKLKVMLREKYSYKLAKEVFPEYIKTFLVPDIVLSLKYDEKNLVIRNQNIAAVGLKDNKESLLSAADKERVREVLRDKGFRIQLFSTTLNEHIYPKHREVAVRDKLSEIASYGIVITDNLHGMIFCALTGTPCVAIDQVSHKVKGEYNWISSLPFISFVDDVGMLSTDIIDDVINAEKQIRFNYNKYELNIRDILRV